MFASKNSYTPIPEQKEKSEETKINNQLARITCPVTFKIFKDPVRFPLEPEFYVERDVVPKLNAHPLTRERFRYDPSQKLSTSYLVKNLVDEYLSENPDKKSEQYGYVEKQENASTSSSTRITQQLELTETLLATAPPTPEDNRRLSLLTRKNALLDEIKTSGELGCGTTTCLCGMGGALAYGTCCTWWCVGTPLSTVPIVDGLIKLYISSIGGGIVSGIATKGFLSANRCHTAQKNSVELASIDAELGQNERQRNLNP